MSDTNSPVAVTLPKPTAAELIANRPRLRALVAEKVMGWKKSSDDTGMYYWDGGTNYYLDFWRPDLRIDQAFEVVEKLGLSFLLCHEPASHCEAVFTIYEDGRFKARFDAEVDNDDRPVQEAIATAICLAALRAKGELE